jgi:hypothetical protein
VIGVRVSADLMRQVELLAADEGLSLSAVCRRAIKRDVGKQRVRGETVI